MQGNINVVGTEWWTLELPEEWLAEEDEEGVVISDQDGIGVIEISTLWRDSEQIDEKDFEVFAEEVIAAGYPRTNVQLGQLKGWLFSYSDSDGWWREWYLFHANLFLYVTYNCAMDHQGLDDEPVNGLLADITLLIPAST